MTRPGVSYAEPPRTGEVAGVPRSADATTILAFFVALQFVLPARLVMNGLPFSLSAASLVALGLGTLWLCTQMTTTLGAAKGRTPVRTMLFVYACVLLASYGNSGFGYLSADERAIGDHAMVTAFTLIFVGLATCDGIRTRERMTFLLGVLVVCGTVAAVVGIVQFVVGFDPTPYLRLPGMHFTANDPLVLARSGLKRVSGTAAHPIEFGVFCAMLLPLAIHLAFAATRRGRRATLWWACVGVVAAGLMFSVSRSAILAAASAGIVLFVGWTMQRRVSMVLGGICFLVVIKLVSPGLLGTFLFLFRNAGNDDSVRWRTHDYATAKELISQHVLLGRGIGTWYAPKHEVMDNQYLLSLVEIGVVGLAAFLGIFAAAVYSALRVQWLSRRLQGAPETATLDRDLALSLIASLAAVLPTYATFDFGAFATVSSLTFVLFGLCGALLRIVSDETSSEPGSAPQLSSTSDEARRDGSSRAAAGA